MVVSNSLVASDLELIVIRWLDGNKINYDFQTSLRGGFYQLGGAVVDFILSGMLAWRVMGEYYHRGVEKKGDDVTQREMLVELGYTVVDIWGDDIKDRTEETLRLALEGQEMLR